MSYPHRSDEEWGPPTVPPYWVTGAQRDYLKSLKVGDMIICARTGEPKPLIILEIKVHYVYGDKKKYYSEYKMFTWKDGVGETIIMDAAELLESVGIFDIGSTESSMDMDEDTLYDYLTATGV